MSALDACRQALREADDLRHSDPQRAVRAAASVRDRIAAADRAALGEAPWLLLQAEAWAVLGSAQRAAADLDRAEAALNVALAFLDAPGLAEGLDPGARPRLAQRAAYLRCDQRRYAEALALIDDAIAEYARLGARQALGAALADRGLILGRWGRKAEAVRCLGDALGLLDPDADPRNFLAAVHNLALYLHELATTGDERRLALRWLRLACRCHARLPETVNLLKLRSLLARAALAEGHTEEGIAELGRAASGFGRLGAVYEQALLLLHLAAAHLGRGETAAVRAVAGSLFPVFRRLASDRDAAAALRLFYRAAQAESATADLIDRVSAVLRRRAQPLGSISSPA